MKKIVKWNLDVERELWRAVCAPGSWFDSKGKVATHPESLWWFIHIAWGCEFAFQSRSKPRWLVRESASGRHVHDAYLRWLQTNLLEWKQKRRNGKGERMYLAIILPRNFGKSVTATRCAALWCHLDDPNMSTLLGSATSKLSTDFLNSIGTTIQEQQGGSLLSWFCWLYGNWKNPNREWTKTAIHHGFRKNTTLVEPSFDLTAVDIGMTGYHHDMHIWDDPIIQNKLREGGTYLDTVQMAFDGSYKALGNDGLLMLVCTRYLDEDVAGLKFKNEGIATWNGMDCPNTMIFEKIAMGAGVWRVYFWQVEDELTEEPTCPEIMDKDRIKLEKTANPENFACQYQNNPGTSTTAPLLESQIKDCFMNYDDFRNFIPVEFASVHLDTAFKTVQNVRAGDDSAIVVFLHDARDNGMVYLHTDLLLASNAMRADEFSDALIERFKRLRNGRYPVRCLTDEKEPGGKEGLYKQTLISVFRGAGLRVPKILQLSRQGINKRARIRKAAALWADGNVKVLLHKDKKGDWILPPVAVKLFNQLMRVDVVPHDDLADASADVFVPGVWRKPITDSGESTDEGMPSMGPGDEALRALSRPLTNDEVKALIDDASEDWNNGLGPDTDWLPDQDRDMWLIEERLG